MEEVITKAISRHTNDKKLTVKSQHGQTEGSIMLDQTTCSVDEGKVVDIIYLDFSKVFDTASLKILFDKPLRYGLDR